MIMLANVTLSGDMSKPLELAVLYNLQKVISFSDLIHPSILYPTSGGSHTLIQNQFQVSFVHDMSGECIKIINCLKIFHKITSKDQGKI